MTTTGDVPFTPTTDGAHLRCLFCETLVDIADRPGSEFDDWTFCDACWAKLEADGEEFERMLLILTDLEREVLMLHWGIGRQCHRFDEIGERSGVTSERAAEVFQQAFAKARSFLLKQN